MEGSIIWYFNRFTFTCLLSRTIIARLLFLLQFLVYIFNYEFVVCIYSGFFLLVYLIFVCFFFLPFFFSFFLLLSFLDPKVTKNLLVKLDPWVRLSRMCRVKVRLSTVVLIWFFIFLAGHLLKEAYNRRGAY